MKTSKSSRRNFIRKIAGTAFAGGLAPTLLTAHANNQRVELSVASPAKKKFGTNDQVNVAIIGMGIMGFNNAEWTVQVPGVKLVGVADLYTGRLDHAKEVYGKDLFITKNYQEILDRKDIDAVIIATS